MPILNRNARAQFWMDIKGKDSFRGVSLSYAWMANQTGHMLLGLVLSGFIYVLIALFYTHVLDFFPFLNTWFTRLPAWLSAGIPTWLPTWLSAWLSSLFSFIFDGSQESRTIWAITIMIIFWTIFEAQNVYKTLIVVEPNNPYDIAWYNVLDDMSIDLMFFFIGGGIFGIIVTPCLYCGYFIFFLVMGIMIYLVGVRWFIIKMYLQIAGFPKQFRLSQWDDTYATSTVQEVRDFMGDDLETQNTLQGVFEMACRNYGQNQPPARFNDSRNLLIFGEPMSGKSKLGIGCASEFAINGRDCAYTTAEDIFSHFRGFIQITQRITNYNIYWTLPEAEVIVIDDISGSVDFNSGPLPQTSSEFINYLIHNPQFRFDFLNHRRVIWVFNTNDPQSWINLFQWNFHNATLPLPVELSGIHISRNTFEPVV